MIKTQFKEIVTSKGEIFIDMYSNSLEHLIHNYVAELERHHCSHIVVKFISDLWGTGINKKIKSNLYQVFQVKTRFDEDDCISETETIIATLKCCGQSVNIVYSEKNQCFQYEDGGFIAIDAQGLYEYMASDNSVLPPRILSDTMQYLHQAGWYENRAIDVSQIVSYFNENGMLLADCQMAFLQEFGGLKGIDQKGNAFEIYEEPKKMRYLKGRKPTPADRRSFGNLNRIAFEERLELICVGTIGNLMVPLWITSDGRLFSDQGKQLGRTIMEGWQEILLV